MLRKNIGNEMPNVDGLPASVHKSHVRICLGLIDMHAPACQKTPALTRLALMPGTVLCTHDKHCIGYPCTSDACRRYSSSGFEAECPECPKAQFRTVTGETVPSHSRQQQYRRGIEGCPAEAAGRQLALQTASAACARSAVPFHTFGRIVQWQRTPARANLI